MNELNQDVEMKDASKENKSEEEKKKEIPEVYTDFIKAIQLIEKSVVLKDMKSLAMSYRLINKFRKEFKPEDFTYLYNLYIKQKYNFPTFASRPFNPSEKRDFQIEEPLYNKTKNIPEIIGYICLILITYLVDNKFYEEVEKGLQFLINFLKQNENLTKNKEINFANKIIPLLIPPILEITKEKSS